MAPPIKRKEEPASPLFELPTEALVHILGYVEWNDLYSLASLNGKCKAIADEVLRSHWRQLKLPNAVLPEGLVDLRSLIGRINQSHPDLDSNPNPSNLFHELANEFANLGAILPNGKLPLTAVDFQVLQRQAEIISQERALIAIWSRITKRYRTAPQLQTPNQIRAWINIPKNAKKIKQLDLFRLNLRVLPPEIGKFTKLNNLFLHDNHLSNLPDEIKALTKLKQLILNDNQLTSLPEIAVLTELEWLCLQNNQLSSLPDIRALTKLCHLNLTNNKLLSLPDEIGALTKLTSLGLNGNQLYSLPDTIENLTKLIRFNIDRNPLEFIPDKVLNSTIGCIRENRTVQEYKRILALATLRDVNGFTPPNTTVVLENR